MAGLPLVHSTSPSLMSAKAPKTLPTARWHMRQWQKSALNGLAVSA